MDGSIHFDIINETISFIMEDAGQFFLYWGLLSLINLLLLILTSRLKYNPVGEWYLADWIFIIVCSIVVPIGFFMNLIWIVWYIWSDLIKGRSFSFKRGIK